MVALAPKAGDFIEELVNFPSPFSSEDELGQTHTASQQLTPRSDDKNMVLSSLDCTDHQNIRFVNSQPLQIRLVCVLNRVSKEVITKTKSGNFASEFRQIPADIALRILRDCQDFIRRGLESFCAVLPEPH